MVKDIFDTIIEKEYHQLDQRELAELAEYCRDEQEFLAMKQILAHSKTISGGPRIAPRETTKQNLDELFSITNGGRKIRPFYFHPVFQAAAVLTIGFAAWLFLNTGETPEQTNIAENSVPKELQQKEEPEQKEGKTIITPTKEDSAVPQHKSESRAVTTSSDQKEVHFKAMSSPHAADFTIEETEENTGSSLVYSEKTTIQNNADESTDPERMITSSEQAKRAYTTVSTPAFSVKDISVDANKSPFVNQVVTSMNMDSQKNVLNYLSARY